MQFLRGLIAVLIVAISAFVASAEQKNFFETYVTDGGCGNINAYEDTIYPVESWVMAARNPELFGKPVLNWSDDDIATALSVYRDCQAKNLALYAKNPALRNGGQQAQALAPAYKQFFRGFERRLGKVIMMARDLDTQRKAQQQAKIEVEKAQAESRRAQAEEEARRKLEQSREQAQRDKESAEAARRSAERVDAQEKAQEAAREAARIESEKLQAQRARERAEEEAHRKVEQLREQAQRDKEAAEAVRRSAEREEPKIAEATREAEEAQRARQEAEQRLAKIRSRTEAQENTRQEALAQKQELERQAELEQRTSGYQRISVETFVLDGGDLAAKAAKVSLTGVYIREGNLHVLYPDMRAAMMATRGTQQQPSVPLLTDDASREFRQLLLTCQSNPQ